MADLFSCPFCGGSDVSPSSFDVKCGECGAEMPGGTERAIAAWNRRAPSPDMREAVEALTMLIYEITHLSAEDDKGRHHCYISKDALESARAALRSLTGAKP